MSGQRVILFVAAGVLGIAAVTLALYFLTRQLDDAGNDDNAGPTAPSVQGDRAGFELARITLAAPGSEVNTAIAAGRPAAREPAAVGGVGLLEGAENVDLYLARLRL